MGCEGLCRALGAGDVAGVARGLANNLAPAARALCPEAGEVEAWLRGRSGVLGAQVTGSGTCSFALCESKAAADAVAADARRARLAQLVHKNPWLRAKSLLEYPLATGCGSAW